MLLTNRARALVVVASLALVGFIAFQLWPKPNSEAIVRRGLECLARQDTDCLYRLAEPEDLKAYGVNRQQFDNLLQDYVYRGGWEQVGKLTVRPGPSRTAYQGEVHLRQQDDLLTFGLVAEHTGSRNELVSLLTALILARMPAATESFRGPERMLAWIERDHEVLENHGVKGLNRNDGFLTWQELQARYSRPKPSSTTGR